MPYYCPVCKKQLTKDHNSLCCSNRHCYDISKTAVTLAAKRTKQVQCVAASVFNLPVADNSCDMVTELFASLYEK